MLQVTDMYSNTKHGPLGHIPYTASGSFTETEQTTYL